jgi:hypothetical protein
VRLHTGESRAVLGLALLRTAYDVRRRVLMNYARHLPDLDSTLHFFLNFFLHAINDDTINNALNSEAKQPSFKPGPDGLRE